MNDQIPIHQRRYISQEKQAMECSRKLNFLVKKANEYLDDDDDKGSRALHVLVGDMGHDDTVANPTVDEIEEELDSLTAEITENLSALEKYQKAHNIKREYRFVLDVCNKILDAAASGDGRARYDPAPASFGAYDDMGVGGQSIPLVEAGSSQNGVVKHICGIIHSERAEKFRSTMFRFMRSNVVTTIVPLYETLPDPKTGERVNKSVFIIFLTSDEMIRKAEKLCTAFMCNLYDCPRMSDVELQQMIMENELREEHMNQGAEIVAKLLENNGTLFWKVAHHLDLWKDVLKRERKIFHTLNKFQINEEGSDFMFAKCWIPAKKRNVVRRALEHSSQGVHGSGVGETGQLSPDGVPGQPDYKEAEKKGKPTYFATNKYTGAFQNIVDAYGVARYEEANPALFALSIFPFLFGVMFGDIMHGTFLLLFASCCIIWEDKLKNVENEMFKIPFAGRYLLIVMSVCAIYMGFIYNEVASVPLDMFGTAYPHGSVTLESASQFTTPYVFGVDPVWRWSGNNVQFTNSYKMKMAIILGIFHMTTGVVLKAMNMHYFANQNPGATEESPLKQKARISLIHESIPELLLFMSIFGYLVILILVKWTTNWNKGDDCYQNWPDPVTNLPSPTPYVQAACAAASDRIQWPRGPPMIITQLIGLAFLSPVQHSECLLMCSTCDDGPEGYCYGQSILQTVLILCALLAVPWLLVAKPMILKREHEESMSPTEEGYGTLGTSTPEDGHSPSSTPRGSPDLERQSLVSDAGGAAGTEGEEEEFEFAEIFIHQVIHTIEYALGTVSNTASYLRLWALSLAHSQLSEVFWDMIFVGEQFGVGLNGSTMMLVMCWIIWFFATLAVLMVMESLSAFLHALRLQWVEFQNKFYASDGTIFVPDSYDSEDVSEDQ